ncbi:hypothetical protein R9X47_17600 [Wukongibacter baidiensis]|uniref:hypothetical protein n=1 Tax=Wukongibacter baidiensis TaxID=1723361 RepID=UPI003D7FA118
MGIPSEPNIGSGKIGFSELLDGKQLLDRGLIVVAQGGSNNSYADWLWDFYKNTRDGVAFITTLISVAAFDEAVMKITNASKGAVREWILSDGEGYVRLYTEYEYLGKEDGTHEIGKLLKAEAEYVG